MLASRGGEGASEILRHLRVMKAILIALIRGYRVLISPLYPPVCRFQPTCSQYAIEAIARFGPWRGTWLALCRVARCHPLHPGGYDPVPPRPTPLSTQSSDTVSPHQAGEPFGQAPGDSSDRPLQEP